MKKHLVSGFTLAEVLITLTIIGVIAALTIPALVQNIQDEQYKTTLKSVYSDLNQAMSRLVTDNGGSLVGVCTTYDSDCLRDAFMNYMSHTKVCHAGTSLGNCWPANYKYMNNTDTTLGDFASGATLTNGASLMLFWGDSSCSINVGSPPLYQSCGWIFIDVNGQKPPNMFGRDIFWINISKDSLKPEGITGDGTDATCRPGNAGQGCAGTFLRNQITN